MPTLAWACVRVGPLYVQLTHELEPRPFDPLYFSASNFTTTSST